MSDKPWKQAERELAALFGTRRRPLSGLNHGTGRGDDAQHEKLYLECKHGKQCDKLLALFADTARKAAKERHPNKTKVGRVPVVGIKAKGQKGMLLVVHSSDLQVLLTEYAAALAAKAVKQHLDNLEAMHTSDMAEALTVDTDEKLRRYGKRLKSGLKQNPLPRKQSAYGAARVRLGPRTVKAKPKLAKGEVKGETF